LDRVQAVGVAGRDPDGVAGLRTSNTWDGFQKLMLGRLAIQKTALGGARNANPLGESWKIIIQIKKVISGGTDE
jgi:hypothetical protein